MALDQSERHAVLDPADRAATSYGGVFANLRDWPGVAAKTLAGAQHRQVFIDSKIERDEVTAFDSFKAFLL